jgi:ADP-dependent NAD(P)H-hydrate dehydratase / NAD(P)H-hydrate epimerase
MWLLCDVVILSFIGSSCNNFVTDTGCIASRHCVIIVANSSIIISLITSEIICVKLLLPGGDLMLLLDYARGNEIMYCEHINWGYDNYLHHSNLRTIENYANSHGHDLMSIAGLVITSWVFNNFAVGSRLLIVVGSGNNGGDGVSAALRLHKIGYAVTLVPLCRGRVNIVTNQLLVDYKNMGGAVATKLPDLRSVRYDLIIDAVFGIGFVGTLPRYLADKLRIINNSCIYILAIDIPSGMSAYDSFVDANSIVADTTISFIGNKACFYTGSAVDHVGAVVIAPLFCSYEHDKLLTVRDLVVNLNQPYRVIVNNQFANAAMLRRNNRATHKGLYGHVAVIVSADGMLGASYLAASASMLLGAGKVTVGIDGKLLPRALYFAQMPELIVAKAKDLLTRITDFDVIVVGPGFATNTSSVELLIKVFAAYIKARAQHSNWHGYLLLDADCLLLIARHDNVRQQYVQISHKIITPHPKEAAALLTTTVQQVQQERFASVLRLAHSAGAIAVLKGCGSLIANAGHDIFINTSGNQALSSAGQGDVLCGIIAALIAQHMPASDAVCFAVWLHGMAGEQLAQQHSGFNGILASETARAASAILNRMLYS